MFDRWWRFVSRYHLKDVIVGKIYFLLVRIKIKHMEIDIIKRETTGTGPNVYHENDTIAKYEIMDGAPVRGEAAERLTVFTGCTGCTGSVGLPVYLLSVLQESRSPSGCSWPGTR